MRTQAEMDTMENLSCLGEAEASETSIICYWSWHLSDLNDKSMKSDVAGAILQLILGAEFSTLSLNVVQILRLIGYNLPPATHRQTFDADSALYDLDHEAFRASPDHGRKRQNNHPVKMSVANAKTPENNTANANPRNVPNPSLAGGSS